MRFSLLCWNIQKRSLTPRFQYVFEQLLESYRSDIVALQEVRLSHGHIPSPFKAFTHALSCNIVRNRHCCGVMTLSRFPLIDSTPYLSKTKEIGIATRKSALLTRHRLPDGAPLSLLNLHAINFVPYGLFAKEIERIAGLIAGVEDEALIVAGDFNTWSGKRQKRLNEVMAGFGLQKVRLENEKSIKSILGSPLDHIYCRSLRTKHAHVVDTPVSDHNPIAAEFEL